MFANCSRKPAPPGCGLPRVRAASLTTSIPDECSITVTFGNRPPATTNNTMPAKTQRSRGKASAITVKPVRRLPKKRRENKRKKLTAFIAVAMGNSSPVSGCVVSVPWINKS